LPKIRYKRIDFAQAFEVYIVGTIALIIGFYFGALFVPVMKVLKRNRYDQRIFTFHVKHLNFISSLFLIAGSVALFLWFYNTGIIPMLYPGIVDELRFKLDLAPNAGKYSRFVLLGSLGLMLKLTCFSLEKSKRFFKVLFDIVLISAYVILSFLHAAKRVYAFPILIFIVNYNYFVGKIKIVGFKFICIVLLILLALSVVSNLRATPNPIIYNPLTDILIIFPVFRDAAKTLNIVDDMNLKLETYGAFFHSLFPREIYSLLGLDKDKLYDRVHISYYFKNLLKHGFRGGGVGVGFLVEFYMNSGFLGVFCGMFIFGMVVSILDSSLNKIRGKRDFKVIIVNTLTVYMFWFYTLGFQEVVEIYLMSYYLIIAYFLLKFLEGKSFRISESQVENV